MKHLFRLNDCFIYRCYNLLKRYAMNRIIMLLLSVFLFISCGFDKSEQITVASEQADCMGVAPQKCFLIKTKKDRSWQYFNGPIEGFAYEPGNEYILMVKRQKISG